jgi:hypothetical protein
MMARLWNESTVDDRDWNAKGKGRKQGYKYPKLKNRAGKLLYGVDKSDPEYSELSGLAKSEGRKLKLRNKEAPYRTRDDGSSILGGVAKRAGTTKRKV